MHDSYSLYMDRKRQNSKLINKHVQSTYTVRSELLLCCNKCTHSLLYYNRCTRLERAHRSVEWNGEQKSERRWSQQWWRWTEWNPSRCSKVGAQRPYLVRQLSVFRNRLVNLYVGKACDLDQMGTPRFTQIHASSSSPVTGLLMCGWIYFGV